MAGFAWLSRCLPRGNNFRIAEIFSHGQGLSPMFVNDTGRLPDSGRVCVVAFGPGADASRTYYDVTINAARAEFERMADPPRNPAHVLGVGAEVQSLKGPVMAAYFAASRERFDAEPNYKGGLFVLVDGAVYAVRAEKVTTRIRRGLVQRELILSRNDRPQRSVVYRWPIWREPFISVRGGPTHSQDFLRELAVMARTYG